MITGHAACLSEYCAAEITSWIWMGSRSYPEYQPTLPFSAKVISSKMSEPPEMVRVLPRVSRRRSSALFLVTLSASFFDRFSIVVATMSLTLANPIGASGQGRGWGMARAQMAPQGSACCADRMAPDVPGFQGDSLGS